MKSRYSVGFFLVVLVTACARVGYVTRVPVVTNSSIATSPSPESPAGPGGSGSPPPSMIGGTIGNGGDVPDDDSGPAPWLGEEAISWCTITSPTFGLSQASAEAIISSSWEEWRDYMQLHRINDPHRWRSRQIAPGDPRLVANDRRLERCDGSQDLTIYLGESDANVERARVRWERPIAFFARLGPRPENGREKALIWVQAQGGHSLGFPNWKRSGHFRTTVLHEIGHALGCEHAKGHIMDGSFGTDLLKDLQNAVPNANTLSPPSGIDGVRELLYCAACGEAVRYQGFSHLHKPEGILFLNGTFRPSGLLALTRTFFPTVVFFSPSYLFVRWSNPRREATMNLRLRNVRFDSARMFRVRYRASDGSMKDYFTRTESGDYQATEAQTTIEIPKVIGTVDINVQGSSFVHFIGQDGNQWWFDRSTPIRDDRDELF